MTNDEIRSTIVDWFVSNRCIDSKDVRTDTNFFAAGLIDSLALIELVEHLEHAFSIRFSNDEFQNREFSTIDGLTKIIAKKL